VAKTQARPLRSNTKKTESHMLHVACCMLHVACRMHNKRGVGLRFHDLSAKTCLIPNHHQPTAKLGCCPVSAPPRPLDANTATAHTVSSRDTHVKALMLPHGGRSTNPGLRSRCDWAYRQGHGPSNSQNHVVLAHPAVSVAW
jgi:hypothetical protein